MICSSHREPVLASSQVCWTRWKNMNNYFVFIFKGKPKPKTKKPKTWRFGKPDPEVLKPQQERSFPPALEAALKLGSCFWSLPELCHQRTLPGHGTHSTDRSTDCGQVSEHDLGHVPSPSPSSVMSLPCCHLQLSASLPFHLILIFPSFKVYPFAPGTPTVSETSNYDLMSACNMFQLH